MVYVKLYRTKQIFMKNYNIQNNIGKCKYVVNYHNGTSKHKDGSPFFDIAIFKNKVKLKEFTDDLDNRGYIKSML